jgi:hypothetical protein
MPHEMRYSVLTVVLACVVLFRIAPAMAGSWMEWMHGTMEVLSPGRLAGRP